MKKTIATALVAVSLLSGCASTPVNPDEEFVKVMRSTLVGIEHESDRALITAGSSICGSADAGIGHAELIDIGIGAGLSSRESTAMVDAALKYIC
jgi:hypothetical protein